MADKKLNQQNFTTEDLFINIVKLSTGDVLKDNANMQDVRLRLRSFWNQLTADERKEHAQRIRLMTTKLRQLAEGIDQEFMQISVGDI